MRILGIDPGISGALVILQDGDPIEWMLTPTVKTGKTSRVHAAEVAEWIDYCGPNHTYIEQVGAMPKQGVVSMFNFGHSTGVMIGVICALKIPYTTITPQAWKREANLIGTDKEAARARAIQLWPTWRALDKKGAGQALADAALIARFGIARFGS